MGEYLAAVGAVSQNNSAFPEVIIQAGYDLDMWAKRYMWRDYDWLLLGVVLLLMMGGVAMIYSATRGDPIVERLPLDQAVIGVIGLLFLFLISGLDYRLFKMLAWPTYAFTLLILVLVLFVGVSHNEAQRWFDFGFFEVQPGEIAKVLLSIFFAKFIADRDGRHSYISTALISFLLLLPCVALILRQPNYSTAITIVIIWAAIVFVGGVDRQYLIFAIAAAILLVVFVTQFSDLLPDYVQKRVTLFLDPNSALEADRYQQTQALIALGSGGMLGQGFLQGLQSQLRYFPVRHTDFIFSVIGEELGFVGALIFLVLLILVIVRSLRAALIATDTFGRLLCTGIAATLFLQTYTNVAMQVGLAPITGIVLPFVSYGRTSLLIVMLSIGLVESVAMRHKKLEFGREG